MQCIQLDDAIVKVQDAERVLSELWEAALQPVNHSHGLDPANNDTGSTSSIDSD